MGAAHMLANVPTGWHLTASMLRPLLEDLPSVDAVWCQLWPGLGGGRNEDSGLECAVYVHSFAAVAQVEGG